MNFYTADYHLFHDAIMRMCGRPFTSSESMNEAIISKAAARVGADDDLWILGDVAFAKAEQRPLVRRMLERIPGRKHLVSGNHEKKRGKDLAWIADLPWASRQDYIEIKDEGRRAVLFHYPMVTWPGARHGAMQFFGHVHDNWLGQRNSINVGVDFWDFAPVTYDEAAARAATLPPSASFLECEPGLTL